MNSKVLLATSLALLFCSTAARGVPTITTLTAADGKPLYTETTEFFDWQFQWNAEFPAQGQVGPVRPTNPTTGANLAILWSQSITIFSEQIFILTGRHLTKFHVPADAPQGNLFDIRFETNPDKNFDTIPPFAFVVTGPKFLTAFQETVIHLATDPGHHRDQYTLFFQRAAREGPIQLNLIGRHIVPTAAPEPASVVLLGTGLAGVYVAMRRRARARRL